MKKNNVLSPIKPGLIAMCAVSVFHVFYAFSQEQTEVTIKRNFCDIRDKDKVVVGVHGVATTGDVARLDKELDAETKARTNKDTEHTNRLNELSDYSDETAGLLVDTRTMLTDETSRLDNKIDGKSFVASPTVEYYGRIDGCPVGGYSSWGDEYINAHYTVDASGKQGYAANVPAPNCSRVSIEGYGPLVEYLYYYLTANYPEKLLDSHYDSYSWEWHWPDGEVSMVDEIYAGVSIPFTEFKKKSEVVAVKSYNSIDNDPYEGYLSAVHRLTSKTWTCETGWESIDIPLSPYEVDIKTDYITGVQEVSGVGDLRMEWLDLLGEEFAYQLWNFTVSSYGSTYVNISYEYQDFYFSHEYYNEEGEWVSDCPVFYGDITIYFEQGAVSENGIGAMRYEMTSLGVGDTLVTRNQLPSAISSYLESEDSAFMIGKRLVERTGQKNELGTGWGYILYDFASDVRKWRLNIPKVTLTQTSSDASWIGYKRAYSSVYATCTNTITGTVREFICYKPRNAILSVLPAGIGATKKINQTREKYQTDACRYVDMTCGMIPLVGTDADTPKIVEIDVTNCERGKIGDVSISKFAPEGFTFPVKVEDKYSDGVRHTKQTNRIERIISCELGTATDNYHEIILTTEVRISYFVDEEGWNIPDVVYQEGTPFHVSVAETESEAVECLYARLVNSNTSRWIYDEGKDVTWAINVTNGCFFTEIVGEGNLFETDKTY